MRQSQLMSLVEAVANGTIGYRIAVATQALLFPLFELHPTLGQNMAIGLYTGVADAQLSFEARVREDGSRR